MWHHPKYYKELRKRNKSDQAISKEPATAGNKRSDQGQSSKRQARRSPGPAASNKLQASSTNPQAST